LCRHQSRQHEAGSAYQEGWAEPVSARQTDKLESNIAFLMHLRQFSQGELNSLQPCAFSALAISFLQSLSSRRQRKHAVRAVVPGSDVFFESIRCGAAFPGSCVVFRCCGNGFCRG